jgi:very-long-chain ceramide synthase
MTLIQNIQTSKCLNYIDSIFTPPYFVSFMVIWAYLRHFINLRILYSLFPYDLPFIPTPANEFATVGNYTLDFSTQQYKCWISQIITFCLLAALQAVNVFWFFLICRILFRLVWRGVQKDERSDDEDDDEEIEDVNEKVAMNGSAKGPKMAVNGEAVGTKGVATAVEGDRRSTLRRKQ